MSKVYEFYFDDFDIVVLYVDVMMNLILWQLWEFDMGKLVLMVCIVDIKCVFDCGLVVDGVLKYFGLFYFYIYFMEMFFIFEEVLFVVDYFWNFIFDLGYFCYMLSYFDILVGDYS